MVMIEAMSCGTPVIANGKGSVPEIIENGKSGYIVTSTEEAVHRIYQAKAIDRSEVRRIFEERFTAERMAKDYLQIYKKLYSLKNNNFNNSDEILSSEIEYNHTEYNYAIRKIKNL